MKYIILKFTLVILFFNSCYKEYVIFDSEPNNLLELELILKINHKNCAYDHSANTLRYSIQNNVYNNFEAFIEFQDYATVHFNGLLLKNNSMNNLGDIEINKNYDLTINIKNTTYDLNIQFTNLPIIQIITPNQIYDEPKVLARIIINYPDEIESEISSYIGIEYRGSSSLANPKKSFSFSFLNSNRINDEFSKSIFNLPKNIHWGLDAMYFDPSRLRNKTSFEIWNQIEGERNYGISSYFVELYINSNHQGLYNLHEIINGEFLGMSFNFDAVLYKAIDWDGPTFKTYSPNLSNNKYWNNWEQKFPEPEDRINWGPVMNLTDLVVNQTDFNFNSQINFLMNIDNFIDYYILLNLLSLHDNVGKNTFLGSQSEDDPIFIIPWDLEGAVGIMWNGDNTVGYTDILSNNLYNRLFELNPNNFKNKLKERWFELRNEVLETNNLINIFEINFNQIINSNIMYIENTKWNKNINLLHEKENINNWIINRVLYLDEFFTNL